MASDQPTSFNQTIRDLDKGQSHARVERVALKSKHISEIGDRLKGMRASVNAAVSKIREDTGSDFRVESATSLTHEKNAILAVVAVTRLS